MASNSKPTKIERAAGLNFVKFLNIAESDEYLEIYRPNRSRNSTSFRESFLKNYMNNGDPFSEIWKAFATRLKYSIFKFKNITYHFCF